MIIFTILLFILLAVISVVTIPAIIAGGATMLVFGDVIVFVLIVILIVKIIKKIKKK